MLTTHDATRQQSRILAIAVTIGVVAAFTYTYLFVQQHVFSFAGRVTISLYSTLLFTGCAYLLVSRFINPRINMYARRNRALLLLGSFTGAILLVFGIPIAIPPPVVEHQLSIITTGQSNTAANGSEVWLRSFSVGDEILPLTAMSADDGWEMRDGVLLSYQRPQAKLEWSGVINDDVRLQFTTHPWSGIALVRWNGQEQQIDLYAPESTERIIILTVETEQTQPAHLTIRALAAVATTTLLALLLLSLTLWLVQRPVSSVYSTAVSSSWQWLFYAAPCILIWSLYLLSYWPGFMSGDSLSQWQELTTGRLVDNHPAFHTMLNWLITRIWLSPAMIVMVQIISFATVFGLTMVELVRWSVPRWVLLFITVVFALSAFNGTIVITLWKDVAYGIAMLGAFCCLLAIARTNGTWINAPRHIALVSIPLIGIALFRHNGLPVVIGILVLLGLLFSRRYWRPLMLLAVVVASCVVLVKFPLYRALDVAPISPVVAIASRMHQIAGLVHDDVVLTNDQRQVLESVMPINVWKSTYNCYSLNPTFYNDSIDFVYVRSHLNDIHRTWLALASANPLTVAKHQFCLNSLVWRIDPGDAPLYMHHWGIDNNDMGLKSQSFWPFGQMVLNAYLDIYDSVRFQGITWRPAFFLYLTLFCSLIAAVRLQRRLLLAVALPSLLNSLILLALIPAQDARYQFPVYAIGLIAPSLLFLHLPASHDSAKIDTNE